MPPLRVINGFVALSNSSTVSLNSFLSWTTSGTSSSGNRRLSTQKRAVGFDQLGNLCERLRTKLAQFTLKRVRRQYQRSRVRVAHRLLDLGDRLLPVFLEIGQDTNEAGAQLGPALLEKCPIDDVASLFGHTLLLFAGIHRPGPTLPRDRAESVKFSLALILDGQVDPAVVFDFRSPSGRRIMPSNGDIGVNGC